MLNKALAVVVVLILATNCSAQTPKGTVAPLIKQDAASFTSLGRPCLFDPERGDVPDCIHTTDTGTLFIAPGYLRDLTYDSHGLAPVHSHEDGWMYVNRKGEVLVTGVPSYDNGPDDFHNGLVRFLRNNKYGFANRKGQIVIPPIYDGAMYFEKGRAAVCKHCQSKCADHGCAHHVFEDGESFSIDTHGARVY